MGGGVRVSTPVQDELTVIWQELFAVPADEVDPAESFFELGGTSLQAVQLMNRIEKAFGVRIPLPVIYVEGSIEGLTAAIEDARAEAGAPDDEAELLAAVEALSEEEALRLLAEHQAPANSAERGDE
uniref:PCP domain protein n=1 Tax=Streptomyces sp. SANK 60404 TaxID=1213862 RepID=A0A1B4ZDC5_9ACTN|nr:PCP domain protein [Streptomyces sp. SANK 60404]